MERQSSFFFMIGLGGGVGKEGKGVVEKVPLVLTVNGTDQKVSAGGRLFIQNARNLHTKVMSNGVEVIVRGRKTALVGFEKTSWLPQRVNPSRPVTLPGHTVSRQFHLKDNPGKLANGIGNLLQSIVRSSYHHDLVTKTMLTTFTYKTTILKRTNTIIKTHEEVVSNVITQRPHSVIQVTPTERPESSTLVPEVLISYLSTSPYITDTLYTTFIYYNTFKIDGLPTVVSSRETVSNMITQPAYLSVSMHFPVMSTRVSATETHFSTYTFSKTLREKNTEKIVTTRETITQVIITEAMVPVKTKAPQIHPTASLTSTFFTTFTHLQTKLGPFGSLVVQSSTSIASNVVTQGEIEERTSVFGNSATIDQTKTLTPVLLYATKVYFTTYTYFTTIRNKDGITKPPKIHSRTEVVSRVATEAIETAFDLSYVNMLKSSYLSKHSTLLDVTSSVHEISPTATVTGVNMIEGVGTLVTQQVIFPKWPKDDDQLTVEVEPSRISLIHSNPNMEKVNLHRPVITQPIHRTPVISSSEEHFDEVKEPVHKIVSVLTDTKTVGSFNNNVGIVVPTRTYSLNENVSPTSQYPDANINAPEAFAEETTSGDLTDLDLDMDTELPSATEIVEDVIFMGRPVSHLPTPPLRTSTERSEPTSKGPLKMRPFVNKVSSWTDNMALDLDLFPDIGPSPKPHQPTTLKDNEYLPDDDGDVVDTIEAPSSADLQPNSNSTLPVDKRNGGGYKNGVSPTKEILSIISDIVDGEEDNKDADASEEDEEPQKIYSIPTTFDTEAFNEQKLQEQQFSNRVSTTEKQPTNATDASEESDETTTEPTALNEDDEMVEMITVEPVPDISDLPSTTNASSIFINNSTESIEEIFSLLDDITKGSNSNETSITDDREKIDENTETTTDNDIISDVEEEEDDALALLEDLFDSAEKKTSTSSTRRPEKLSTRYTTSRRPTKKNRTKKPTQFSEPPFSDEFFSGEDATKVYALAPVRIAQESLEDYASTEAATKNKKRRKPLPNLDLESEENSSESEEMKKKNRNKHRIPVKEGFSGPSKSAITFPIAAAGGAGSGIATAATSAFNWKPLLNLGAIGLGGLGASTLSNRLGPIFNSMAGYMKGINPISRNDTQHSKQNKQKYHLQKKPEKSRRPYLNHHQSSPGKEPVYIPLHNDHKDVAGNYRFTDGGDPSSGPFRRPVTSHANEPNFRPLGREPDFVAGPLPPPVHHHFVEDAAEEFPPKNNYNFLPPEDNQPNIFDHHPWENVPPPPGIHKHGNPLPPTGEPRPEYETHHVGGGGNNDGNNRFRNEMEHPRPPHPHPPNSVELNPEGKTEFNGGRPMLNRPMIFENNMGNFNRHPNSRPGVITPIARPENHHDNDRPPFPPSNNRPMEGQGPVFRPRPGPASIEMINEIRDSHFPPNAQIILPQKNKPFMNEHHPNNNDRPPQGPLRINIPGLNLHGNPNEGHNPWAPHPTDERFNQNPFRDGQLNPPILKPPTQRPQDINHPQAASLESFEHHFPHDAHSPAFNHDGFITDDHFNEVVTTPRPLERERPRLPPHPHNDNFDNDIHSSIILPPKRPIPPFNRPPQHDFPPPERGPQRPMQNFRDPPPLEDFRNSGERHSHMHSAEHSSERPPRPIHNVIEFDPPPPRLPPWPTAGPGPGQLPGRFPSPMHIMDRPQHPESSPRPSQHPPQRPDIFRNKPQEGTFINVHPAPRPPLARPPLIRNPPSTVYIVEEPFHDDDDFDSNRIHPPSRPSGSIHNHRIYPNSTDNDSFTTTLPPLVIQEVTTPHFKPFPKWKSTTSTERSETESATTTTPRPTTTIRNTIAPVNTTNRALISRLFIRRFTTTTTSTTTPPSFSSTKRSVVSTPPPQSSSTSRFVIPPWASKPRTTVPPKVELPSPKPSVNSAIEALRKFEQKYKEIYGNRKPSDGSINPAASSHAHVVDSLEGDEDEYYDESVEPQVNRPTAIISRVTTTTRPTTTTKSPPQQEEEDIEDDDHPNHHPFHKPPIDVTKYLKDADEDEFGQLYQGSEDKNTVIDPVNQKVIVSPLDHLRRNISDSKFNHRSSTPTTANGDNMYTLSESKEEEILKKYSAPKDLVFNSTPPGNSKLWWPTTFRPNKDEIMSTEIEIDIEREIPTTFRPNGMQTNDILPAATGNGNGIDGHRRPQISSARPRPAPQDGLASFYDDEDSMGQIKMKNIEIHKLPSLTAKRPGVGIALVKPEDLEKYEKEVSGEHTTREKLNKGQDNEVVKEYPEFPETYDSTYDEDENVPSSSVKPSSAPPKASHSLPAGTGTNVTGNGHRESSYMYEEEYYDDDDGEGEDNGSGPVPNRPTSPKKNPAVGNIVFFPKQQSPPNGNVISSAKLNPGGHKFNGFPKQQQQQPIHGLKLNSGRPPTQHHPRPHHQQQQPPPHILKKPLQGTGIRIFQTNRPSHHNNNHPQPLAFPKTEMEPPPIDSNRLRQPALELPSSGPIPISESGIITRPNLLRPNDGLFKPDKEKDKGKVAPTPQIHTIASVDEYNKIIGTNKIAIHPTRSGEVNAAPSNDLYEDDKNTQEYEDDVSNDSGSHPHLEASEGHGVAPSRRRPEGSTSVIKYTGGRLQTSALFESSDSDGELYPELEDGEEDEIVIPTRTLSANIIKNTRTSTTPGNKETTTSSSTSTSTSANRNRIQNFQRRPFIPTIRSTTTKPTSKESSRPTPAIVRRPFIPTRGPGPNIVPWARRPQSSTTKSSSERTTSTQASKPFSSTFNNKSKEDPDHRRSTTTLISTSVSTSGSSGESPSQRPHSSEKKRTQVIAGVAGSTLPPFLRRPGLGTGTRRGSSEERNITTTLLSRFIPTQRPTPSPTTRPTTRRPTIFENVTTAISTSTGTTGSDEYEEYSYEDQDDVSERPFTTTDNGRPVEVVTVVNVKQSSAEIRPSKVLIGGRPSSPHSGEKENRTTRYVTRIDSQAVTVTESETSTITTRGVVQAQTVYITRTIPPETLVSTIVGSVTLVNTLEITPTVVRSTVFSEPTRIPYTPSFVDNSEGIDIDTDSTERVRLSGIVTKENYRPSSTERNNQNVHQRPTKIDARCPTNCTLSPGQNLACRSYANGTRTRCDCKPGYARMKAKYPCRPTFTYEMQLGIRHMDGMQFELKDLYNAATDGYLNFITVTKEAIDKAFLATDIKRQFQGSEILDVFPTRDNITGAPRVNIDFLVQLTTNITEDRIKNHFYRTLRSSNFSVGRTGVISTASAQDFTARDFNECKYEDFHDCSTHADCFNVRGSFSCKCKAGFKDKSSKRKPGRDCQETSGCSECNFRGTCHKDSKGNRTCHCFKWHGGTKCQINLKFLLIAITGIGSVLFILVMLCGTLICRRKRSHTPDGAGSGRFMRYRGGPHSHTMERAAIMNDSGSSDGHQSPHPLNHSFTPDSLLVDVDPKLCGAPSGRNQSRNPSTSDANLINFSLRNVLDGHDRPSMAAVVIPRAKIKPPSRPASTHALGLNSDNEAPTSTTVERNLINYLEQGGCGTNNLSKVVGGSHLLSGNERQLRKFSLPEHPRKISQGALVSSGEAVSAIGGMRRSSTTALNPNDAAYSVYTKSVSEVRSYDETIRCAAKPATLYTTDSRASCYSCKPPSYCAYSESHGHTMGDRDGASTVYTTQGKLFKLAHHHHEDASSTASSQ